MSLWAATVGALVAALAASVLLSRRDRAHLPVVAVLLLGLVVDLAVGHHDPESGAGLGIAHHLAAIPKPWHGDAVTLYHASNALVAAWPAALAGLALWLFVAPRWAAVALLPWATLQAVLVARWPLHGDDVRHALLVHEWIAVAVAGVAVWRGWGREWSRPHHAALALAAVELVIATVGPFRLSIYRDWDLARVAYVLGFTALAAASVRWLRRPAR